MVIIVSPAPEDAAGVGECVEHFFIEAFIAALSVKAFNEAILLRLARRDIVPGDAGLILPFEDGATGQLRPVVRDDSFGPAVEPDAAIQFAGNAGA